MVFAKFAARSPRFLPVLGAALLAGTPGLQAAVTVNAALPITHEVIVQPIITEHSSHGQATFMGSSSAEAYIKEQIDRVWAQSGIDVTWLPPTIYQSNFAYDGSTVSNYYNKTRPQNDLRVIRDNAGSPPKSSDATVINMFFVEIVPGFQHLPDNYANGLASIDANGICMHVGSNLPNWTGGRDVVASVIAHEIGHNLGLSHYSGSSNLMASGDPDSYLVNSQTNSVFSDSSWRIDGYDFLIEATTETNYDLWTESNLVIGGPDDDDDGDGIRNVIEFMLDLNPQVSDSLPTPVWSASGLTWTLPKNADAVDDGLELEVEVSSNCSAWSAAGSNGSSVVLNDNSSQLAVRLNSGQAGSFMRLNVTIPDGLLANAVSATPEDEQLAAGALAGDLDRLSSCADTGCGCRAAHHP